MPPSRMSDASTRVFCCPDPVGISMVNVEPKCRP